MNLDIQKELVSVIIPTHNRARMVVQAVESVLAQTYPQIEIIVVDDGSTDNTEEILDPYITSHQIRYFKTKNYSAAATRNFGIARSNGTYIAFLDSDDIFLPKKLDKQVAFYDAQPGLGLIHGSFSKFDSSGIDLGFRDLSPITGRVYPQILLTWSTLIHTSCVLTKRIVLSEIGGFDETLHYAEDLDLWLRIVAKYPIGCVQEPLVLTRVHTSNMSTDKLTQIEAFTPYLMKALDADPEFDDAFRVRAITRMYNAAGRRLLGDPDPKGPAVIREWARESLQRNPFQWEPYQNWLLSLLPRSVIAALYAVWLRLRYPRKSTVHKYFHEIVERVDARQQEAGSTPI